ncbi:hypothetical protein SARC_08415 [Sphaeroforma arctica JP610]|uniref:Uncharacterized protein n=1 Tax=Sphaeroforma arctica JP610 TaxID=667725 RepID=A0A0L0FQY8_9EUKA|nr:hypothetical protein SARC_08415 [Sphaeroforma arctica JP610]KNC79180.1 hypothetical protein SARC_08415 [Sphaeroforma arctica JP610]|eukprot:XP_014153082.1 hypothetical protein SARC_08415 [Sphaeroforma arctica JP610]
MNVLRDGVVTALSSTWPHARDREVKARAIRSGIKNPGNVLHRKLYYGEISPGQLVSMFADELDPIATDDRQRLEGENWRQNIPIPVS